MAKIMHKSNHIVEGSGYRFALDTYTGKEKTSMVLKPVRIGKNLQQWLDEIHKEEVRKQA